MRQCSRFYAYHVQFKQNLATGRLPGLVHSQHVLPEGALLSTNVANTLHPAVQPATCFLAAARAIACNWTVAVPVCPTVRPIHFFGGQAAARAEPHQTV